MLLQKAENCVLRGPMQKSVKIIFDKQITSNQNRLQTVQIENYSLWSSTWISPRARATTVHLNHKLLTDNYKLSEPIFIS